MYKPKFGHSIVKFLAKNFLAIACPPKRIASHCVYKTLANPIAFIHGIIIYNLFCWLMYMDGLSIFKFTVAIKTKITLHITNQYFIYRIACLSCRNND